MKVKMFLFVYFLFFLFFNANAQNCRRSPGRISRNEARILNMEQRQIQRERQLARADGIVTRREHRLIQQDKQRLRRKSHFFYHN